MEAPTEPSSKGLACAAAPASTPAHLISRGVTVSGVRVGGLTAEPARQRITASFLQPIRIATPKGVRTIDPAQAGAVADVDAGLSAALSAMPGSDVAVPVQYSAERAAGIVSDLAARFDRRAINATVTDGLVVRASAAWHSAGAALVPPRAEVSAVGARLLGAEVLGGGLTHLVVHDRDAVDGGPDAHGQLSGRRGRAAERRRRHGGLGASCRRSDASSGTPPAEE